MTDSISPKGICLFLIKMDQNKSHYLLLRRSNLQEVKNIIIEKFSEAAFLKVLKDVGHLQGTWQMISGKINAEETASEAALRELFEETGIVPDKFYSADIVETFYSLSSNKIEFVPVFVGIIYTNPEIKLCAYEHDTYQWLPFEQARDKLVWSEQKRSITHIDYNFVHNKPLSSLEVNL